MELEPELLLQEARENVEAAQSYRRELGQRLQGLRAARRQVGGPRRRGWGPGARAVPGSGQGRAGSEGWQRPTVLGGEGKRLRRGFKETWQAPGTGAVGAGGPEGEGTRCGESGERVREGAFPKLRAAEGGLGGGSAVGRLRGRGSPRAARGGEDSGELGRRVTGKPAWGRAPEEDAGAALGRVRGAGRMDVGRGGSERDGERGRNSRVNTKMNGIAAPAYCSTSHVILNAFYLFIFPCVLEHRSS